MGVSKKYLWIIVGGIVLLFGAIFILGGGNKKNLLPNVKPGTMPASNSSVSPQNPKTEVLKNTILAYDQNLNSPKTVFISEITLEKPGYIVVFKANGEKLDKILGYGGPFKAKNYKNITMTLNEEVAKGDAIFAVLYQDDGNGLFDANKDQLIKDQAGNPVRVKFTVIK